MGDRTRAYCVVCGGHVSEVGELSWTGKCARHSMEALTSNVVQMVEHRGPNFERWRQRMAASVGAVLLDEQGQRP